MLIILQILFKILSCHNNHCTYDWEKKWKPLHCKTKLVTCCNVFTWQKPCVDWSSPVTVQQSVVLPQYSPALTLIPARTHFNSSQALRTYSETILESRLFKIMQNMQLHSQSQHFLKSVIKYCALHLS